MGTAARRKARGVARTEGGYFRTRAGRSFRVHLLSSEVDLSSRRRRTTDLELGARPLDLGVARPLQSGAMDTQLAPDDALRIANERNPLEFPYYDIRNGDIMDTADVAGVLGITASSLRAMRAEPERHPGFAGFPAPFRRVGSAPIWRTYEIRAWIAQRP